MYFAIKCARISSMRLKRYLVVVILLMCVIGGYFVGAELASEYLEDSTNSETKDNPALPVPPIPDGRRPVKDESPSELSQSYSDEGEPGLESPGFEATTTEAVVDTDDPMISDSDLQSI